MKSFDPISNKTPANQPDLLGVYAPPGKKQIHKNGEKKMIKVFLF